MLVVVLSGCHTETSSSYAVLTGENAASHLKLCKPEQIPSAITDLWIYEGGTFNGMVYYVSFECQTIDDCWKAVRAFGAPQESEFTASVQTKFAVNQQGPSFYDPGIWHPSWDVSSVQNGVSHEEWRGNDVMDFWAIDRDRLRVYYHHESGGFPDDPPSVAPGR